MAIVKMKKFSLFIFPSDKKALMDKIQNLSFVQFIDLKENMVEKDWKSLSQYSEKNLISELESNKYKLKFTIDVIYKFLERKKSIKDIFSEKKMLSYDELRSIEKNVNWIEICKKVKNKEEKLNSLINEELKIKSDIDILSSWRNLDVSFKELNAIKSCIALVGSIPKKAKEDFRCELEKEIEYFYMEDIGEEREESNLLLVIHKELKKKSEQLLTKYGFTKALLNIEDTPCEAIENINNRLQKIYEEKVNLIDEIKCYEDKLENLQIIKEYYENEIKKMYACENFLNTNRVIVMRGWIPEEKQGTLKKEISEITKYFYIECSDPSEEDDVPIMLKNNELVRPFEFITSTYSLPKYKEIDPTPLLVPFYLIFFGMMLSDAGYGLLMLIASSLALKFMPLDDHNKSFVKLFLYLSVPTIFWGIMYGSFFTGFVDIPAVWMKPEENANFLLIIAILFGLIQIYVGLGIKAYLLIREKKYLDAVYDVGLWYITITTVLLYLVGVFANVAVIQPKLQIIKYVMFGGMIGLVLTQGRVNKGIGAKLGSGLYGLYGITGYIGDLVSYSRLMALGLATGFIGGALNLIISFLGNGIKAWLFGPVLFIVGHVFNLLINALGAYVHTSRLQYVEYFGKFYEGGGKEFAPLEYENRFIKIKR